MSFQYLILIFSYLEEDREVNDGDCGRDEKWLLLDLVWVDEQHQSEGYSPTQSTVRHDELFNVI